MSWEEASSEFRSLLGEEHFITETAALKAAETATFATNKRLRAIARPQSTREVAACMKLACRYRLPVYPSSRGNNYGYGSRVPTCDGAVLLDMSRMNRISDFDPELGTFNIEPGVSFEQAARFLQTQCPDWLLAGTGAPWGASVLANALERGLGKGPAGNRVDHFCDLEVVLPTGEVLRTGVGRYENAVAPAASRACAGPLLDQAFSQSNLGVVTRMSLWLTRRPKHFQSFVYFLKRPEQLPAVIDALRDLRMDGVIRSSGTIFNDYRLLGFASAYPWHRHSGDGALPRDLAQQALREKLPVDALWVGDGALFCQSAAQARAERALVRKALRPHVSSLLFFDKSRVRWLDLGLKLLNRFKPRQGPSPLDIYYRLSPYLGNLLPPISALGSVYFRKLERPKPEDLNPERDGCGVHWTGPLLPFRGRAVAEVVEFAESTVLSHGYEPALSIQMATDRALELIASVTYDRSKPGEDERARACHDALFLGLAQRGYYPYRLGVQSQPLMPEPDDAYLLALQRIKAALDPDGILAPGRYDGVRAPSVDSTALTTCGEPAKEPSGFAQEAI